MKLIDDLIADHRLIEQVVGAFQGYVAARLAGPGDPADAARFFRFFRGYVGGFHHHVEEVVLFAALTGPLELPADRGPVFAIGAQHHTLAECLDALEPLLAVAAPWTPDERASIAALTRRYCHGLWSHIDAEDSVLFPESAARLVRAGLAGLAARAPTAEEEDARRDGERLVQRYPPVFDPTAMRGEGCPACPSYGVDCDGLERAWWTESEWEGLAALAD